MSRQDIKSCDCTKSELDIFTVPPTQTSIEDGAWVETHPVATLTDRGPIEFDIPGDGSQYFDLANIFLYLKASIRRGDGTVLQDGDRPGPCNNWLHTLFQEVEVKLGDTVISTPTHTYPYRAYLESLLSLGNDAKETQLTTSLWYKDTAGQMEKDTREDGDDANKGLVTRGALTAGSTAVEMLGRLHCDIFSQERLLLNKVPLRLKLIRSPDRFSLMAPGANPDFKVAILAARMYVRRVDISPSVFTGHQKALAIGPAKYPIKRVVCKYFTIPQFNIATNQENLFSGQMPTKIIVGMVDTEAFNGSYKKNPYNFQHFNVSQVALSVPGFKEPLKPLTPRFPDQNILSYLSLLLGTNKWGRDEGIGIDRTEYGRGYTLFAWDLSPDLSEGGDHFQLKRNTSVRLELKFRAALARPVNVIVYAEFENMIMIDSDRSVTTNFSS